MLRRVMLAAGVVAVLASLPAAFVRSTYGGAAAVDEPYYLLPAISLWEDGDLDIDDELDEARWRAFHDATLPQQAATREDGSRVSPHDPLLSVLLAVPYELGGLTGARWFLAIVNGLLAAAVVHLAVRRLRVRPLLAGCVAAVAGASVPFVVYGAQVYPELPAALAVTLAVDAALGAPSPRRSIAVAASVIALPWLAVKYVPAAAAIAALHLWRLWRAAERAHVAALAGAYTLAAVTYAMGHLAWYGGLTVYAAGDFFREHGGQASVVGTAPNPLGRTRRLIGLLVDRDFGIASWQPAWLLTVPAAASLARRRPDGAALLGLPLLAGWLSATFVAVTMHGFWFPGRQLVHVLPLAAVAVAWWLDRRGRRALAGAGVVGAWGLAATAALLAGGLAGDLTFVVDFARANVPGGQLWRRALPDHLIGPPGTTALTAAWAVALAATAATVWLSPGTRRRHRP